jgi:hypothetical protein
LSIKSGKPVPAFASGLHTCRSLRQRHEEVIFDLGGRQQNTRALTETAISNRLKAMASLKPATPPANARPFPLRGQVPNLADFT